ncbi:UNVERIFIED_CONTAM: hypothetical protein PYX00_005658 [Menopon gallinae]|uniref:Brix domain-containing protein n=1 Tax=Menopon gallinae TaxID=328185 RepID=A0AAW2HU54_9NEOP
MTGTLKTKRVRASEMKQRIQLRKEKKKEKKQERLEGKPKQTPKTIESMRIKDETMITDLESEENIEVKNDIDNDEFSNYFEKAYIPKILITTSDNAQSKTRKFCKELTRIIPNSIAKCRSRMDVKPMVKEAINRGFSDVIIINENQKMPNGLLLIHLPNGPTANFRLSNVRLTSEMKKTHKEFNKHRPEVILNNFSTRLGYTISRMLAALFHYEPEFRGRRCVTFHNQRDYIFFRHHRYMFTKDAKPRLMELGPRFTLKLRSLQLGTFDTKTGEYEWIIQNHRHDMETSRRKFFL